MLWNRLGEVLEEFANAWEHAPPEPEIEPFISHFPESIGIQFHIAALAELIKLDLEHRSKSTSDFFSVSQYAERWPVLNAHGPVPPDLIYEEARVRKLNQTSRNDETVDYKPSNLGKIAQMIDPDLTRTTSVLTKFRATNYEPGMTIDDFDLLSKLGRGAFATVFLARQNSMQRLVALKISADHGVEGQTLAQLDHPHIVRVYDQRVVGDPPVRLMYMQYIAGSSLKEVVGGMKGPRTDTMLTGHPFVVSLDRELDSTGEPAPVQSANRDWIADAPWHQVVSRLGSQLANALAYSHSQGVLHRDIKPANVLVDLHGFPKLVDFNISFSSDVIGTTAETYFGGSLAYMSPEQLEASSSDFERTPDTLNETTDIYSLGIVLHELLTGVRPFAIKDDDNENELSLVQRLVHERKNGLNGSTLVNAGCENELLVDAITSCLAAEPNNRFQSAKSLQRQLGWACDQTTTNYIGQTNSGWRSAVAKWPFLSIILTGLAISMFATWFVICFNAEEAIAPADQETFYWLRRMTNRIVYPIVLVVGYLLIRPVCRAVKRESPDSAMLSAEEFTSAVSTNLNLGGRLAIAFAIAWAISGVSYPVFLTALGANVSSSTWSDFILSHILAGLITAAYFFCTVSTFSLSVWHPRLLRKSLKREISIDVEFELAKIQRLNRFFQVLAIATPLAAIAVLVNFRTGLNTFAVGVLSTASFFGLGVLAWTARHIENSIKTLRKM